MNFENYINDNYRETIFLSFLFEGVYDPSIFKAIFLAGGPGSGKSFVAKKTTLGMGLKMVNSDILFEKLSKEAGVNLKKMSFDGPDVKIRDAVRNKAKSLTNKQLDKYINSKLGLVIDGTGKNYVKIEKQRKMLEKLGYDTYMIFVNTSLEVALERNEVRDRSVPEEIVTKSWQTVQNNIGKFQGLFGGSNFKIVDNSSQTSDKNVFISVWKDVMKFTRKEVVNIIAKQWINLALDKKALDKKGDKNG